MTEYSLVLLICLVVIVVFATLLCAAGWGYLAALAKVGEPSAMFTEILAHTPQHGPIAPPAAPRSLRRSQAN